MYILYRRAKEKKKATATIFSCSDKEEHYEATFVLLITQNNEIPVCPNKKKKKRPNTKGAKIRKHVIKITVTMLTNDAW